MRAGTLVCNHPFHFLPMYFLTFKWNHVHFIAILLLVTAVSGSCDCDVNGINHLESHSRIFTVVNLNDSGLTHAGYFLECSLLVVGSAFLAMLCMGTVQVLCSQCLCRARTTRIAPLLRTTTPTPNHYNKMNSGQNEDKVIKLNRTKRITFYKRKNRNLKDKVRPLGIFIFIL